MINPSDRMLALRVHELLSQSLLDVATRSGDWATVPPQTAAAVLELFFGQMHFAVGDGYPAPNELQPVLAALAAHDPSTMMNPIMATCTYSAGSWPMYHSLSTVDDVRDRLPAVRLSKQLYALLAGARSDDMRARATTMDSLLGRYLEKYDAGLLPASYGHALYSWQQIATEDDQAVVPELGGPEVVVRRAAEELMEAVKLLGLDPEPECAAAVLDCVELANLDVGKLLQGDSLPPAIADAVRDAVTDADPRQPIRLLREARTLQGDNRVAEPLHAILAGVSIAAAVPYYAARARLTKTALRVTGKRYSDLPAGTFKNLYMSTEYRDKQVISTSELEEFRREMAASHIPRRTAIVADRLPQQLDRLPGQAVARRQLSARFDRFVAEQEELPLWDLPPGMRLLLVGPAAAGQDEILGLLRETLRLHDVELQLKETTWGELDRDREPLTESTTRLRRQLGLSISGSPESYESVLAALAEAVQEGKAPPHLLLRCSAAERVFVASHVPDLLESFTEISFEDYTLDELVDIFDRELSATGHTASEDVRAAARSTLATIRARGNFRNALLPKTLAERVLAEHAPNHVEAGSCEIAVEDVAAVGKIGPTAVTPPQVSATLERLHTLVGLTAVKDAVQELVAEARFRELRRLDGFITASASRHLVFTGNPGTAKTTVARLLGDVYSSLGILSRGGLIEASPQDLIGVYSGESVKKTQELIERAVGGVLFIDEAYQLSQGKTSIGREVIGTLLRLMEDQRNDLVVIVAGYPREMAEFLSFNPGLRSRFPRTIHFSDYSVSELSDIFEYFATENGFEVAPELLGAVRRQISAWDISKRQGNGREVRNLFEQLVRSRALAVADMPEEDVTTDHLGTLHLADLDRVRSQRTSQRGKQLAEAQEELDGLIGLADVKEVVHTVAAQSRADAERRRRGHMTTAAPINLVFQGNPGTAKTTVARVLARILAGMGTVESGHLIEVSRADLVGEYIGQTAPKVMNVVNSARGGVLFIDEAYLLSSVDSTHDFGPEAIGTLMSAMESYRNDLVVVIAGETEKMQDFLERHPSFAGRFSQQVSFPDYDADELVRIFVGFADRAQLTLGEGVRERLRAEYIRLCGREGFDNGRAVRNAFEATVRAQARRISGLLESADELTDEALRVLRLEDVTFPEDPVPAGRLGFTVDL